MQTLFSIILPLLAIRLFLIRFLLCTSRLPILLHSLTPPSTPISITYRHFHSSSFAVHHHHHHSVHPSSTLVEILFSFFFFLEMKKSIQVQTALSLVAHPGPRTKHSLFTLLISGLC